MGMFDSVWVECPKCGTENEFQSKSGFCGLEHYKLDDCPDNVLVNVNRHSPCQCHECGILYEVDIHARKAVLIKPKTKTEVETEKWVDEYILKFKCPPTYREIREHFKIDNSAAYFRCRKFKHKMRTNFFNPPNSTTMKNENNPLKGNESILAKVDPLKAGEIIHEAMEVYLETGLTPRELAKNREAAKINTDELKLIVTDTECIIHRLVHHSNGETETVIIDPNELTKEQLIAILTRKK